MMYELTINTQFYYITIKGRDNCREYRHLKKIYLANYKLFKMSKALL